jgi:nucleoside-diphosphate-sugar epimerase
MSNILVTGGLGFIGHNVVQLLEQQGHNVLVVDNETTYGVIPQDELSKLILERKQKIKTNSLYFCDIADPLAAKIFEQFNPNTVIHLASFPRQKVVNNDPVLGSATMSTGLLNLLEASVRYNVKKFVYISSSMVYGEFSDGVREDAVCNPLGQYGILKLAGEWLVRDYTHRTGLTHTIIRPSAVYGPRDVEDRVISKFFAAAMRNETIHVKGADECLDFTYVEDIARGIVKATLTDSTNNKTYNVTRGRAHSLLDAAKLVQKIVGQGTIEVEERDTNFPSRGALNIEAACRDFLYTPLVDIEQGFKLYYDWLDHTFHRS